jgi:hypothetical protein
MRTQRRMSDSEREGRRERDRERLKQAAEQLLTGEGWQRWVRVRRRAGWGGCDDLSGALGVSADRGRGLSTC